MAAAIPFDPVERATQRAVRKKARVDQGADSDVLARDHAVLDFFHHLLDAMVDEAVIVHGISEADAVQLLKEFVAGSHEH
jgi:hypothetical protein